MTKRINANQDAQWLLSLASAVVVAFGLSACDPKQLAVVEIDTDGDTVFDTVDEFPNNAERCYDKDVDGCDDCAFGAPDPDNDGDDFDQDMPSADGICDAGDLDDDNDNVADANEPDENAKKNQFRCGNSDGDNCDDCAKTGVKSPANDGPDLNHDGVCDISDPKTPAQTVCITGAGDKRNIAPTQSSVTVRDSRHNYDDITAQGINAFSNECAQFHTDAVAFLTAPVVSGCGNNSVKEWSVGTFFVVIAQDGTALDTYTRTYSAGQSCATSTIASAGSNCLDNPAPKGFAGCKLEGGGSSFTFGINFDINFAAPPSVLHKPLETYPFVTQITFNANDYVESTKKNTAVLIIQARRADGTIFEIFNQTVHNDQNTANANPYTIQVNTFFSGLESLRFWRVNGAIAVRNLVVSGRR